MERKTVLIKKYEGLTTDYLNAVLADNPVAFYALGIPAGAAIKDLSGHSPAAQLESPPAAYQTTGLVPFAYGMGFDGSATYATLPNFSNLGGNFTYEAWGNIRQGVIVGANHVLPSTSASTYNPILWVGTNGYLYGNAINQNTGGTLSNNVALSAGFHQFAITLSDNGPTTLYLDGQPVASNSNGASYGGMTYWTMGTGYTDSWPSTNGGWFYADGTIQYLAIYPAPSSPAQVLERFMIGSATLRP